MFTHFGLTHIILYLVMLYETYYLRTEYGALQSPFIKDVRQYFSYKADSINDYYLKLMNLNAPLGI